MTTNPYSPPKANFDTEPVSEGIPALWNPGVTSVLSFFFTPIFGGIINMKNWRAMGEPEKASQSYTWALVSLAFYTLIIVTQLLLPDTKGVGLVTNLMALAFFIAWYVMSGKEQKDVIAYRYGTSFEKRGWTKPVLAAIGCYLGIFVLTFVVALVFYAVKGQT